MTLRQMAARLAAIVEENKRRGWDERNDLPMLIEVSRISKKGRRVSNHYHPNLRWVSSCRMTLKNGESFCGLVNVREDEMIK